MSHFCSHSPDCENVAQTVKLLIERYFKVAAAQSGGTNICCFALCCNPSYLRADGCKAIELIDVPKEDQRHGIVVGKLMS